LPHSPSRFLDQTAQSPCQRHSASLLQLLDNGNGEECPLWLFLLQHL
jgi:hypothetical protein